jgi:BMFP domain-containing protein YqiC
MPKSLWNSLLVRADVLGVFLVVSAAAAIASPVPRAIATQPPAIVVSQKNDIESPTVADIQKITPVALGAGSEEMPAAAGEAGVLEQIQNYSDESTDDESAGQITNASQFRDVQPSDWAFEALDRIVQRYGCLVGYPDGTYRGNRSLSRYEFAAGLNACLRQIETLIANQPGGVSRSDFEALQRLNEEFRTELATLGTRIDNIEGRAAFLEQRQFSTTTKLNGVAIFGLAGVAAGENANGEKIDNVPVLGTRTRLNIDTSFTGKDLLRTRIQVVNLPAFSNSSTFTPEGDLRFTAGTFQEGTNDALLDALLYSFPIGEKTTVVIEGNAGAADDFTNTVNPGFDGDGDSGALSNFGTRNPIYYLTAGAGIGLRHEFSDNLELSLGFLANNPVNTSSGNGLFNGSYGAIAQLTVKPSDRFTVGLTYLNAFKNDLTAGSNRANPRLTALNPNPPADLAFLSGSDLPTSSNAYGVEASFQVSPNFVLNGWVGYTATRILSSLEATDGTVLPRGDLSIWNWAVALGFPNLGKEGNLAGIIVGMEPKVTRTSNSLALLEDRDTSLHVEGFYQYQLTDNIAITPGVIWLTAPDHNNANDDIVIGTIRTTFTF